MSTEPRNDGRSPDDLREINIITGFVGTATGSALIEAGGTRVICTASVDEDVPRWMAGQGTRLGHGRVRDAARVDGRAQAPRRLEGAPRRPHASRSSA